MTSPGMPLETAYVEILPDFSKFPRKVREDLRVELARLEIEIRDAARAMERAITNAARDAGAAMARDIGLGAAAARLELKSVGDAADGMGGKIRRSVKDSVNDLENLAKRGLMDVLRDGFQELSNAVQQLGSFLGKVPPMLLLIIALAPPIIALASALADLAGFIALVPAGIATLAATVIPAVVAFQNFGEAVSALAAGTPKTQAELEKLNTTLGKLSPAARVVAKEVAGLVPLLQHIQRATQEAFFIPLQGVFPQLAFILGGPIKEGLQRVAFALGNITAEFVKFFSIAENVTLINNIFVTTAKILGTIGPAVLSVFVGLGEVVNATLPFIDRLNTALAGALTEFANFITRAARDGSLNKFVEDAFKTANELWGLLKSIGGLLGTLFAGTNQSGHDLINTLTDMITKLDQFLNSKNGQETLKELVIGVKAFGFTLMATANTLIFLQDLFINSMRALKLVGEGFFIAAEAVGKFFEKVGELIGQFFDQIPQAIDNFHQMLAQSVQNSFDAIFTAIGTAIGAILFAVEELPGRAAEFISSLPQRIADALSGTGPAVDGVFHDMFETVKKTLADGWDEIIGFIKSVPDRIAELGPLLMEAGRTLIRNLMNGFRFANNFISDVAGDIVNSMKNLINRAISKINDGIAIVEQRIPGGFVHLGRIPLLASGGLALGPAMIGEQGQPELALPLNDPRAQRAIQQAIGAMDSGTVFNFGPGSIQIMFDGVVPTPEQAQETGRHVAQGMADLLARTNTRMAIRAM